MPRIAATKSCPALVSRQLLGGIDSGASENGSSLHVDCGQEQQQEPVVYKESQALILANGFQVCATTYPWCGYTYQKCLASRSLVLTN